MRTAIGVDLGGSHVRAGTGLIRHAFAVASSFPRSQLPVAQR